MGSVAGGLAMTECEAAVNVRSARTKRAERIPRRWRWGRRWGSWRGRCVGMAGKCTKLVCVSGGATL